MIGYLTLGTNDIEKAAGFYDELLAIIGASRFMEEGQFIAWATSMDKPAISVTTPYDGNPATVGNGVMAALVVDAPGKVDALHAAAMSLGGKNEGEPGPRGDSGFYAGYFRDLDGNKLAAYCIVPKN